MIAALCLKLDLPISVFGLETCTVLYCSCFISLMVLDSASTQAKRPLSNHDHYLKTINRNLKNPAAIQSVGNATSTKACILKGKCKDNTVCENFQGYFELQQHKTQKRNSAW